MAAFWDNEETLTIYKSYNGCTGSVWFLKRINTSEFYIKAMCLV